MLSYEELAHYATLHAAGELPPEWVDELVKRFTLLLGKYEALRMQHEDLGMQHEDLGMQYEELCLHDPD